MPIDTPRPSVGARYGLIQLAGKQVLPNVMLALPLLKASCLRRHLVLHSEDEAESLRPARHLTRLLHDADQHQEVHWAIEPVDADAGPVWDAARHEIETCARDDGDLRWILNATGGTKPMAWGLMQLARHPRVAAVVYRDLGTSTWHVIGLGADGRPDDRALPSDHPLTHLLHAPSGRLDTLPLLEVLASQFAHGDPLLSRNEGRRQTGLVSHPTHGGVDVLTWLRAALQRRSFARAMPAGARPATPISEGQAFESWCGHVLRALGATRALWGVTKRTDDGNAQFEFDVVACHGDRLLVIDTKLEGRDSTGKTAQMSGAASVARLVAGLGTRSMVLRPNWVASPATTGMAADSRILLVTRKSLRTWHRVAAAQLGLAFTADQERLAQALGDELERRVASTPPRAAVFAHGAPQSSRKAPSGPAPAPVAVRESGGPTVHDSKALGAGSGPSVG